MNWLVDNWFVVVAIVAVIGVIIYMIYRFFGLPSEQQKAKVKEWLVWACIEAEKELQTGTGQLKLRKVYDAFIAIPAFSWVAKIISFETFSEWVDTALMKAKNMIASNAELAKYVYGEDNEEQVAKLKAQLGI